MVFTLLIQDSSLYKIWKEQQQQQLTSSQYPVKPIQQELRENSSLQRLKFLSTLVVERDSFSLSDQFPMPNIPPATGSKVLPFLNGMLKYIEGFWEASAAKPLDGAGGGAGTGAVDKTAIVIFQLLVPLTFKTWTNELNSLGLQWLKSYSTDPSKNLQIYLVNQGIAQNIPFYPGITIHYSNSTLPVSLVEILKTTFKGKLRKNSSAGLKRSHSQISTVSTSAVEASVPATSKIENQGGDVAVPNIQKISLTGAAKVHGTSFTPNSANVSNVKPIPGEATVNPTEIVSRIQRPYLNKVGNDPSSHDGPSFPPRSLGSLYPILVSRIT